MSRAARQSSDAYSSRVWLQSKMPDTENRMTSAQVRTKRIGDWVHWIRLLEHSERRGRRRDHHGHERHCQCRGRKDQEDKGVSRIRFTQVWVWRKDRWLREAFQATQTTDRIRSRNNLVPVRDAALRWRRHANLSLSSRPIRREGQPRRQEQSPQVFALLTGHGVLPALLQQS